MFIVRSLKWILIILMLLLLTAAIYLTYADLNWMKPRIESAVAEATGRTLKMNGDIDLDIIPSPAVTVEDVSFSNADWGSGPTMIQIGHFSTEVGLWSLLSGPVRIHNLRLNDVDVLLEKNQDEQANWELGSQDSKEQEPTEEPDSGSSGSDGLPVMVESAEIRNIKVTYREAEAEPAIATLATLDIKSDDATYMNINASGEVKEQAVKLTARLGPEKAMAAGPGVEVSLEPAYGEYSLKANGSLDALADAFQLHGWTIQYKDTETQLDGKVSRGADSNMTFNLKAAGPSLASLEPGLPAIPFKAALVASIASEQIVLDDINTTFGDSDLSGNVKAGLGDKTVISGKLNSKRMDLTPFAGTEEDAAQAGDKEKEAEEGGKGKKKSKYVFVEEPLNVEPLNTVDVDLKTTLNQFIFKNIELKDVVTNMDLKNGDLHLTNRFSGASKGRSASDIKLATAGGKSAKLDVDVKMRDLRINLLSGDGADPAIIPPMDITVDLKAAGTSPRALAASSTGRVLVTQGKGKIESGMLGMVSGGVIAELTSALNPFAKQDKYTTLDCTILGLEMKSGKTDISGLLLQSEKVKAMGEGDIDLNTEALNMEFETQPREGIGVSADMFVTPFVQLTGTLASPAVGLNKKGALLKGGAAVATGGLSLLAEGAASRAAGSKDRCATMLGKVGGHPPIDQ